MPPKTTNNRYHQSIFTPPGGPHFLTRSFYQTLTRILTNLFPPDHPGSIHRLLLLLAFLGGGSVFLLIFRPADVALVYNDEGYEEPSIVYARDSKNRPEPIAEFYRFNRQVIRITPDHMLTNIVRAFIATEDNNFLRHIGVDPQGILRAALTNLLAGGVREGASTITQQAARLRFLSRERSLFRKAREAVLALIMETRFPKNKIMETYLNEVPLGHGSIGAEAAARFYFDRPVFELSWGEAAIIASLTTRPRDFSPLKNLTRSRNKVRVVFHKLVESGDLSVRQAQAEYHRLEEQFYTTLFERSPNDSSFHNRLNTHPHAAEYVKYNLPESLRQRLYTGGLRIHTTIRTDHQAAAEATLTAALHKLSTERKRPPFRHFDAFDEQFGAFIPLLQTLHELPEFKTKEKRHTRRLRRHFNETLQNELHTLNLLIGTRRPGAAFDYSFRNQKRPAQDAPVEGSLISLRPFTGQITAVVGGSYFSSSNQQLRFLTSRRQPGSAIKPLIYAAGLEFSARHPENGRILTAATVQDDSPVQFVERDLSEYSPRNYSRSYEGRIRLRRALALSKNVIAVRTYEYMGPANINPVVEQILGFDALKPARKLPLEASVALGSYALTPYELARAYAVFASDGLEVRPHVIEYVTDSSRNMLLDLRGQRNKTPQRSLISPGTARIVSSMLGDVVEHGTGKSARIKDRPAVGKTGTTNRNTDAWFAGFTPQLVTVVHVGYDRPRPLGPGGTGGGTAAPIWSAYMTAALQHEKNLKFDFTGSSVNSVAICALSGKLPGLECEHIITELFLPATEPAEICNDHQILWGAGRPMIRKPEGLFSEDDF